MHELNFKELERFNKFKMQFTQKLQKHSLKKLKNICISTLIYKNIIPYLYLYLFL